MASSVIEFGSGAQRIQRNRDCTGAHHRQVGNREPSAVAAHEGHTIASFDTELRERPTERLDLIAQLAVGGGSTTTDDRRTGSIVLVDDGCQVHDAVLLIESSQL